MVRTVRTVRTVHAARLRRSLARAAHTSVFALAACGGGGDAPAGPPAPPSTPTPTVAVQVAPGQLTLAPGTIDAVTVSITRTNVTGAVTLSLSGLPAGVSAPSVSSSAATEAIPLTATSATAIAAATVTVTASAAGAPNASATFSLVVPALPAPAIRYPACGLSSSAPVWVAAQDGTGAWRQLAREGDGTYAVNVASKGGIAVVSPAGASGFLLNIFQGTRADLVHLAGQSCPVSGTRAIGGTMAGVTAGEVGSVQVGSAVTSVQSPGGPFTLGNVAAATLDLVAVRRSPTSPLPTKVILRPGIDISSTATLAPLDFAAAEAIDPEVRTATFGGIAADEGVSAFMQLRTPNGTNASLGSRPSQVSASAPFAAIPLARLPAGHLQALSLVATENAPSPPRRSVLTIFRAGGDQTVTFGERLGPVDVTTAGANPMVRLRAQHAFSPAYPGGSSLLYSQSAGGTTRTISAQVTQAWSGSGEALDYTLPDFSGVFGWSSAWGLVAGVPVSWNVSAYAWTGAPPEGVFPAYADGIVVRTAGRVGSVTP